jgi:NADH dehydrogenase
MSGIFLTGATGFLGGRVLRRLAAGGARVVCLARDPSRLPALEGADVDCVRGDLDAPERWADALRGCDTVVHLAALTGKARAAEHFRVNSAAVGALLEAAERAGVRRFVLISTIAVRYPDLRRYPYARAKEEAETRVRTSGLEWAIVRPTVVLGPGSPLWEKFLALARAPVLPVFGDGRNRIQPVHVDDVAEAIAAVAESPALKGRVVEVGGRDVLPMEAFLRLIRREATGKEGPVVRFPVGLLIRGLAAAEPLLHDALPATAGQFYVFAHDSDAAPAHAAESAARRGVAEIVAEHLAADRVADLPAPPDAELDAECETFCRYLIGSAPGEYVKRKYREAHAPGRRGPRREAADPLTAMARRGPGFTRLADAWSAVLSRGGTFRRKLVLLLAVLESTGETSGSVDRPDPGSAAGFFVGVALRAAGFALTVAVSLVAVPVLMRGAGRPRGDRP